MSDTNSARMVWSYFPRNRMAAILNAGELPLGTQGVRGREKAAVWFSANPIWEPTAGLVVRDKSGIGQRLDRDQTLVVGGGLGRIGVSVETAHHDWKAFKRLSNARTQRVKDLYNLAITQGSRVSEWFFAFEPVPRSEWLTIEVWEYEQWMAYTEDA